MNKFKHNSQSLGQHMPPPQNGLHLVCASDTPPVPLHWIWRFWLSFGKFHLLAGAPSTGKTTLMIDIAARFTNGGPGFNLWPDKSATPGGDVIIWTGEDGVEDTVIPRLIAGGANMMRVHIIRGTIEHGHTRAFDFKKDLPRLSDELAKNDRVGLIVIDSIVQAVAGDSNKNSDVRKGLAPLIEIAERHNCAVVGITHVNKNSKGKHLSDRVNGSLAYSATARVVLLTAKIEENQAEGAPQRYVLVRAKSNIGPDTGGFEYQIAPVQFQHGYDTFQASKVVWNEVPLQGSAKEIVRYAESGDQSENLGAVKAAEVFLKALLTAGPRSWPEIEAQAQLANISPASLKRAKLSMKIQSQKQSGHGSASPSFWYLPMESGNNSMGSGFMREGGNPAFGSESKTAFGNFAAPQPPYQPGYPTVAQPPVLNPLATVEPVEPVASVASADNIALAARANPKLDEGQLRKFVAECRKHYEKLATDPELVDWDPYDLSDLAIDRTFQWVDDDFYDKDLYKSTVRSLKHW